MQYYENGIPINVEYLPGGGARKVTGYGGGSTVASISGSAGTSGQGPYGRVPTVPDPAYAAAAAYAANLAQMDKIKAIMQAIDQQSAISAQMPLLLNLPNYQGAMGQAMANVTQMQAGEIPGDVWGQMQQRSAERGIGIGSPLSPATNTALLRATYDTSTRLQQAGTENLIALMNAVPKGRQFDPSSILVSPSDVWQAQWLANQAAAAPDPTAAAMAELAALRESLGLGRSYGAPGGYTAPSYPTPSPTRSADTGRTSSADIWAQTPLWARGGYYVDPAGAVDRWKASQPKYYNPASALYAPLLSGYETAGTGGVAIGLGGNTWDQYGDLWYNPNTGESSYGMPPTDTGWSYQAPGGTSLTWSGQDWSDLFGD